MSFVPILPLSGAAGWAMLKRTMATQTAAMQATPEMARDTDYFRANIGKVTTADQLVGDRRLLKVALGAFGLEADIGNKAFPSRSSMRGWSRMAATMTPYPSFGMP